MRIRTFIAVVLLLAITAGVVFILLPNRLILTLPLETAGYRTPVWGALLGAFAAGTLVALVLQVSGLGRSGFHRARGMLSARRGESVLRVIETGRQAEREGRFSQAIEAYREAGHKSAGHFDASMRLGDLLHRMGRLRDAVGAHEEARRLNPLSDEPGHALALEFLELGELDKARKELSALIEKNPKSSIGPLRNLRELEIRSGDWAAAAEAARRLEGVLGRKDGLTDEDQAQSLGIRTELAQAKAEEGEMRTATGMLRKIIKEEPTYSPARLLLIELARDAAEIEAARESLIDGFKLTGDAFILDGLVEADLARERPEEAISTLRGVVATRQHERNARFVLGKLYLRLEMLDEAAEQFSQQLNEGDGAAAPTIYLARVEERRRNNSRAATLYHSVFDSPGWTLREYRCTSCHAGHENWNHRCPECGAFGSIQLAPDSLSVAALDGTP